MPTKAKTILMWLVVIFVIYAIVKSPDRSAQIVSAIADVIVNAVKSIGQFFSSLLS